MHIFTWFYRRFMTMKAGVMSALCVRCQADRRQQDWTRITILVLIVVILVLTAIKGWTLADVLAVIVAATAAPSAARNLGVAAS
jgi:hypothetical protein